MRVRLGSAEIDLSTRTVIVGNSTRRIAPKPAEVLRLLIEAEGDVVSRDLLLDRVWPHVHVGEEVLTQAIAELRRTFGDKARGPEFVETIPKSGYRLAAPISERTAQEPNLDFMSSPARDGSIEALDLYLRASEHFDLGGTTSLTLAHEMAERSTALDPTFAPARALLAATIAYRRLYYGGQDDGLRLAAEAADLAIAADPRAPEGHAARGYVLATRGDWKEAVRSFNQAMRLSTDTYFVLYLFGRALLAHGYHMAASSVFNHAARIRGEEFHSLLLSANAQSAQGSREGAVSLYRRAAFRAGQVIIERPDDLRARVCLFCARVGEHGMNDAEKLLEAIGDSYDPVSYYAAGALARAGEADLALDWLEGVMDNGWDDRGFITNEGAFSALTGEPRFRRLMGSMTAA